jgi:hypothetical protein
MGGVAKDRAATAAVPFAEPRGRIFRPGASTEAPLRTKEKRRDAPSFRLLPYFAALPTWRNGGADTALRRRSAM